MPKFEGQPAHGSSENASSKEISKGFLSRVGEVVGKDLPDISEADLDALLNQSREIQDGANMQEVYDALVNLRIVLFRPDLLSYAGDETADSLLRKLRKVTPSH